MAPWLIVVALSAAAAIALGGCRRVAAEGDPVDVTYAASLARTMGTLEARFGELAGRAVRGHPRGSVAGARLIGEGLWRRDVYITADPATLELLGPENPGWAIAFARSEIVIAYSSASRFAAALDSVAEGSPAWHEVVMRPGFRLGRTDAELDPKGFRAIFAFRLAEKHYDRPGLAERILTGPAGEESVFPEEHLSARVEMGTLDGAVFYLAEAKAHGLGVIRLPRLLAQTDLRDAESLAAMRYRTADGRVFTGSPIVYAATIPTSSADPAAGVQFISFLLGGDGRAVLEADGFRVDVGPIGERDRMPAELSAFLGF